MNSQSLPDFKRTLFTDSTVQLFEPVEDLLQTAPFGVISSNVSLNGGTEGKIFVLVLKRS